MGGPDNPHESEIMGISALFRNQSKSEVEIVREDIKDRVEAISLNF